MDKRPNRIKVDVSSKLDDELYGKNISGEKAQKMGMSDRMLRRFYGFGAEYVDDDQNMLK
jgi:hypothetical protein